MNNVLRASYKYKIFHESLKIEKESRAKNKLCKGIKTRKKIFPIVYPNKG